jgi:FKBP-type peptidyl-prolyl cis-trans isomerase SlpA
VIQKDSLVTMHFDVRLKDGSIAESTRTIGKPMTFQMGKDFFSPKLETELLGLEIGAKPKIMLMPEDAFGPIHPANIYQVPRTQFKGTLAQELEVGLIVVFTQPDGRELPGIIHALDEVEATVDFNHPLAGQVILFDIEIIDVKQP